MKVNYRKYKNGFVEIIIILVLIFVVPMLIKAALVEKAIVAIENSNKQTISQTQIIVHMNNGEDNIFEDVIHFEKTNEGILIETNIGKVSYRQDEYKSFSIKKSEKVVSKPEKKAIIDKLSDKLEESK